jgi:hypothetical protein
VPESCMIAFLHFIESRSERHLSRANTGDSLGTCL